MAVLGGQGFSLAMAALPLIGNLPPIGSSSENLELNPNWFWCNLTDWSDFLAGYFFGNDSGHIFGFGLVYAERHLLDWEYYGG